jgi:hypothetical protein
MVPTCQKPNTLLYLHRICWMRSASLHKPFHNRGAKMKEVKRFWVGISDIINHGIEEGFGI